jgi:hypothetical protein
VGRRLTCAPQAAPQMDDVLLSLLTR